MSDESKTLDALDLGSIPFIADPAFSAPPELLGAGDGYFDVALLDTGAATHIITQQAFDGFDLVGNQLTGTAEQDIGGATGVITTAINDAAGFYTAGLGDRTADGAELKLDTGKLRGQTSFATLTAPEEWTLPNILGLPMAAQHAMVIRNSQPVIFQHEFPRKAEPGQPAPSRTVRTPQVELIDLGTGDQQGITRRAPLILNPGIGFVQGPQFVFNLGLEDLFSGGLGGLGNLDLNIANDPASPSVVIDSNSNGGGLFLEVDLTNGDKQMEDRQLLFDTGASLTVVSQIMAKRLGFDAVLDTPDFELQVEGSGGVQGGVPGFYLDELNIDTIGGDFTMRNVPIAVLDVTNPNDPGNIIDGIIGTHLFNGRDLVIDAEASFGQGGNGPSLYIGDPVTNQRSWDTSSSGDQSWETPNTWQEAASPDPLSDVRIVSDSPSPATGPTIRGDEQAYRLQVRGPGAVLSIGALDDDNASLTLYNGVVLEDGGTLHLHGGSVDTQVLNLFGGVLSGTGQVFVGTGPIESPVRNLSGVVSPEPYVGPTDVLRVVGQIDITGDFSNGAEGTLVIDVFADGVSDLVTADRFVFVDGTLDVRLAPGAADFQVGDAFTILTAADELFGVFETVLLPYRYDWQVNYDATSVTLEVTGLNELGDINGDGLINAADYTTWRDGYGDRFTIGDYLDWKAAMQSAGMGLASSSTGNAPEPASGAVVLLAAIGSAARRRGRRLATIG